MSELHIDITSSDKEIKVTRIFDAPRELVWEAFTDPKQIAQWWGPKGFSTTIEEYDLRPGGTWKHVMRGPDGAEYPNKSVFREVVKFQKIAYAHVGSKVGGRGLHFEQSWTLETVEDNKTRLIGHQVFESTEDREMVIKVYGALEGAKGHFQCLSNHLAKTPFTIERTFDASAGVVWKAITDVAQMREWYFDEIKDFKPEVGFETEVIVRHEDKEFPHLWKVTEVVPGKKLAYSWKYKGHVGDSLVTFELFPEGAKTRLKLIHEGLDTFLPQTHPQYARGNFAKGWTSLIGKCLPEFLEKYVTPDRDFIISRVFDAPRELVWKSWTDPKLLPQWWHPKGFANPTCKMDVRVGGAYRITMRAPDGTEYPAEGVYRELVEPKRLVMTMDCSEHPDSWHDMVQPNRDKSKKPVLDSVMTVTFEKLGEKTKLTICTRFASKAIRDSMVKVGMPEGWGECLDSLATYLSHLS